MLQLLGGGVPSSSNIGYEVTFKIDDENYYIMQCLKGDSIVEPPTPTKTGETFTAWQLNGTDIAFPYIPNDNVELMANFATVRTEMEITGENTVLFNSAYGECKKVNAGMCLLGVPQVNDFMTFVVIGEDASSAEITGLNISISTGTYSYNGKTYYYSARSFHSNYLYSVNEKAYRMTSGNYNNAEAVAKATLDHYFYKD